MLQKVDCTPPRPVSGASSSTYLSTRYSSATSSSALSTVSVGSASPANATSVANSEISVRSSYTASIASLAATTNSGSSGEFASSVSSASSLSSAPASSVYIFDGVTFTSGLSGLVAGTATVQPGGTAVTISSHTFSLGPSGSTIAVDGTLSALTPPQVSSTIEFVSTSSRSARPSVYTFDGIVFTSDTFGLVAGIATVQPGGSAVIISSHTFSLGPAGSTIAVDGTLLPLTPPLVETSHSVSKSSASHEPSSTPPPSRVYTIDGIALTGNPSSALTIAGSTITPGGPPAIVSRHTFSIPAAANDSAINVDGTLTHLSIPTATSSASPGSTMSANIASVTTQPSSVYTIDGIAFTGNPTSLATANWTLTAGGSAMTISSHTFQIPTSAKGGSISVDGTLTALPSPGAIKTTNLGPSTVRSRSSAGSSVPSTTSQGSSANSQPAIIPYTFAVTATDTAIPAGFYAQASSNADWRSNTWLTTTDERGHTTIVPVLVGCRVCGGLGFGIILWDLPPIPDVSFSFPKFNLPSFSLPCIPIPFIKSCSSPGDTPKTGNFTVPFFCSVMLIWLRC